MIDVCIGNLGKYNEGELACEWVKLPTDSDKLAEVYERIGIDNIRYEEYFIADSECLHIPSGVIGEYSSLEEINYLASLLEELEHEKSLDGYSLVADYEAQDVQDAINLTQCISDFSPHTDITTYTDLGYYLIEDVYGIDLDELMGENMSSYFDYEAYARDYVANGDIQLSNAGMYWSADLDNSFYTGLDDIPDEYWLFSPVESRNMDYLKNTELDTEENHNNLDGVRNHIKPKKDQAKGKASVLDGLKECKESIAKKDSFTTKNQKASVKHDDMER